MQSIKKTVKKTIVINKSTFINYLIHVRCVDDVLIALDSVKKQHPDASHYCTAYLIGNHQEIQKANDDGEPSKTAGYPMLDVLKKHHLTDVLSVTVRYFGGIKLGAGGLVRAYTKSVAENILTATFSTLTTYCIIEATVSFDMIGHTEHYIRDSFELLDTTYDTAVTYLVKIKNSVTQDFINHITNMTKGAAIIKIIRESEQYE